VYLNYLVNIILIAGFEKIPRIVDDDVYLPVTKVCSALYKSFEIFSIQHITWYSNGLSARLVDAFRYLFSFLCAELAFIISIE
jgi:hypothetical protein